jgi:hypothetical protein
VRSAPWLVGPSLAFDAVVNHPLRNRIDSIALLGTLTGTLASWLVEFWSTQTLRLLGVVDRIGTELRIAPDSITVSVQVVGVGTRDTDGSIDVLRSVA